MASLVAVAYGVAGNVDTSTPVPVIVANAAPVPVKDTLKPVVKSTNPVAGKISGSAIVRVDTSAIVAGTHSLYAVARDAAGNSSMCYVQVTN